MLNQHRQSAHMGQKFRCDHENCADHPGYNSRAKLAEHKRKHTGMLQLVKCERCCLSFSDRATMRVHMKKEHEDYDLE
jgi:hypothetical protein